MNFRWWLHSKRYSNLWDWVKNNYSINDLSNIVSNYTETDMHEEYDVNSALTIDQQMKKNDDWQKFVKNLYNRYGGDIWHINLSSFNSKDDKNFLQALSRLPLASQVNTKVNFEEFMVRNALQHIANKLLKETYKA